VTRTEPLEVLVVAPEPLASAIADRFELAEFDVATHTETEGALEQLYSRRPHLIVVDVEATGGHDLDILSAARFTEVAVIAIGRDAGEAAAVSALRSGADSYMALPLRLEELAAQAHALMRRMRKRATVADRYVDGALEVDHANVRVRAQNVEVTLTPIEFRLLAAFTHNPGRVLSADEILEFVWGEPDLPRGRVKLYIGYLRRRFERAGVDVKIETVRGFGYRYTPVPQSDGSAEFETLVAPLNDLRGPSGQPFFPNLAARQELLKALAAAS
jgi:DNA-binding response OmpR family regulator